MRDGVIDGVEWPRTTERLVIRPGVWADARSTWEYRRLESVNRWITAAPETFEAYTVRFVAPEMLAKTLVVELDGTVIGDLMLAIGDAWGQAEVADRARRTQAELGWSFHPDHGGRGYATEAVTELIRICFDDLGLRRVTAECFAENTASRRLIERVGMRLEHHSVRNSLHRSGQWMDGVGAALLAEEWSADRQ